MSTTVKVQIQQRIDTASNWTTANPTLLAGEVGWESDTKKYKIGDGSTAWASLSYAPGSGGYTAGTGVSISGSNVISASAVALTTVQTAANQTAHLALTTQEGDVVVRSDENKSYVRNSGTAGSMADFTLLATPTDAVLSVNGNTGAITADQLAAAIESATDSNTFTDADHTKLNSALTTSDLLDEDNFATDSATKAPSQQSTKAYVDASSLSLIDEDNLGSDSATRPPSQQSVKAYVDAQTLFLIDEDNLGSDSATRPPSQQSVKAYVDTADALKANLSGATFTGDVTFDGGLTVDTNTLHVDATNNRCGIGTISPQGQLHVGASTQSDHEAIIILNNGGATGQEAGIEWRYENITTPRAKIHLDSSGQDLRFATADVERMRIKNTGRIGINTQFTDYGTLNIKPLASGDHGAINVENLTQGAGKNNVIYRSVDLGSTAWADAELKAREHNFKCNGTQRVKISDTGVEIDSSAVNGKLKIQSDLTNYGVVTVRDANDDNSACLQCENAVQGTDKTNVVIRSVDLNSNNWANAKYNALSHIWNSGNTEVARVDSDGIKLAANKGINFSAYATSASGSGSPDPSSNCLDDYEEGFFTPKLGGTTNSSTYNIEGTGTYIKIGRKVTVSIRFNNLDLDNSAAGTAKVYNMPFTAGHSPANGNSGNTSDVQYYNVTLSGDDRSWYIGNSTTAWIGLVSRNNNTWDSWSIDSFESSTFYMNFSGTYFTDS